MKAAQFNKYGGPEVIELNRDAAVPKAGEGQILVEGHAASINAIDLLVRAGYMQQMFQVTFPATLLGDFSGEVKEVEPGHAVVIKRRGTISDKAFTPALPRASCSFERIYFSRGNDVDIYRERQALGGRLAPQVLKAIDRNWSDTVFGFIPNTAEVAYYGLMSALRSVRRDEVKAAILKASREGALTEALVDELVLRNWPRGEKVVGKDIKIRTFIGQENFRKRRIDIALVAA